MEDGVVTEDGVHVQKRVVVVLNIDLDLVLTLLQDIMVMDVLVHLLNPDPVR